MDWLYHESSGFGERPIAMRRVGSIHGPRTVLRGAAGRTLKVGRSSIIPYGNQLAMMAYVSYPRIQKLSAYKSIDVTELLGLAVAHEIGHLLFGLRNHAKQGIIAC
jgi:hypothetical protein